MRIKGFLKDISGTFMVMKKRKERIVNADEKEIAPDYINLISKRLHPGRLLGKVVEIIPCSKTSKKIVFENDNFPLFNAGNYLTIRLQIGGSLVTRAYSIASSPLKAYKEHKVEIVVKRYEDGFVSKYIYDNFKVGDEYLLEVGLGYFNIEETRDHKNITAIAGGAGITPFLSMYKDILERNRDIHMNIIYGSDNPNDIIAKEELDKISDERIKIVHVISGDYPYSGEKGFINKQIIQKYSLENSSYFICGPKIMEKNIRKELRELGVRDKDIRSESFASYNPKDDKNYPKDKIGKVIELTVNIGVEQIKIPARCDESLVVALERSGIKIVTSCRSGECGYCRTKVIKGDYYIPIENNHIRGADKKFNYVHACMAFPLTNMEIRINIEE